MGSLKRRLIPLVAAAGLALASVGTAAAHPGHLPIVVGPGGLVNVVIIDAVDIGDVDVTLQLPVAIAANVCDVNAAVLLAQIADFGSATCTAGAEANAND
jgi:hypothetical protein